jgi:hypothetical protein
VGEHCGGWSRPPSASWSSSEASGRSQLADVGAVRRVDLVSAEPSDMFSCPRVKEIVSLPLVGLATECVNDLLHKTRLGESDTHTSISLSLPFNIWVGAGLRPISGQSQTPLLVGSDPALKGSFEYIYHFAKGPTPYWNLTRSGCLTTWVNLCRSSGPRPLAPTKTIRI